MTIEDIPPDWNVEKSELVMGNVVISLDYFKRVAASLGTNRRPPAPRSVLEVFW